MSSQHSWGRQNDHLHSQQVLMVKMFTLQHGLVLIGSEMTWAAAGEASLPYFSSSVITWPQPFILSIRRDGWQPRATEPSPGSRVLLSWNIFNTTLKTAVAFLYLKGDVLPPSGSTNLLSLKMPEKETQRQGGPRTPLVHVAPSTILLFLRDCSGPHPHCKILCLCSSSQILALLWTVGNLIITGKKCEDVGTDPRGLKRVTRPGQPERFSIPQLGEMPTSRGNAVSFWVEGGNPSILKSVWENLVVNPEAAIAMIQLSCDMPQSCVW